MRAGKLDRFITLERKTETVAPTGNATSVWSPLQTVRAEVVANNLVAVQGEYGAGKSHALTFRIRYIPGLQTGDRLIFNETAFEIVEIIEIGRRRGLELRAVASP